MSQENVELVRRTMVELANRRDVDALDDLARTMSGKTLATCPAAASTGAAKRSRRSCATTSLA